MAHPAGRRAARAVVPVLAVVVLGAVGLALHQPAANQTPPSTAPISSRPASQPVVARPLRALEPPVRVTAPDSPAPTSPPVDAGTPADTSGLKTRWVADWSNMRRLPSNEAPVVRVLAPGTMVRGTPGKWGWWAIQYQGDTVGYVAGALLRPSRPTSIP